MVDQNGKVVTDTHCMPEILRQHWATVFAAEGIDELSMQRWLEEDEAASRNEGPMHDDMAGFRVRR